MLLRRKTTGRISRHPTGAFMTVMNCLVNDQLQLRGNTAGYTLGSSQRRSQKTEWSGESHSDLHGLHHMAVHQVLRLPCALPGVQPCAAQLQEHVPNQWSTHEDKQEYLVHDPVHYLVHCLLRNLFTMNLPKH